METVPAHQAPKASARNQILAVVIVNILTLSAGALDGWVSPSLLTFAGPSSPLGEPLSPQTVALLGSLPSAGSLLATPALCWAADRLGRKPAALLMAVPVFICWTMKLLWVSPMGLMLARVIGGIGCAGVFILPPLYAVEVGSHSGRGALGSLMAFNLNVGVFIIYALGYYASYSISLAVMIALPIVFLVCMTLVPETPPFLVRRKRDKEAAKAIAWLRSIPEESAEVKEVLANLKYEEELANSSRKKPKRAEGADGELATDPAALQELPAWRILLTSAPTRRAFLIVFLLLTVKCFMGKAVVVAYASQIFTRSGSQLSPGSASLIVAALLISGSIFASSLIEKCGRRALLIVSCAIGSLCMGAVGIYFFLQREGHDVSSLGWIPVTALSIALAAYGVGIGPVPFILPPEMVIIQARALVTSILSTWMQLAFFLVVQMYTWAVSAVGIHGVFWGFSSVNAIGVFVAVFLLPETKGRPLDEIVAELSDKKTRGMMQQYKQEHEEAAKDLLTTKT